MQITGPRPKPATLEDIAKIAGVHRRTVRDALQGTGRVAPATRENVRRIARELQYVPNLVARALATGKTGRVSVLCGSLSEPFNVNAVQHLADFLNQHGYEAMIIQGHPNKPTSQSLRSSLSDGIIIVGNQLVDEGALTGDTILPWVLIDAGRPATMDHITLDLSHAVSETIRLMIASGRQRIAYINKHTMDPNSREVRYRNYIDLMHASGLETEMIIASEVLTAQERIDELKEYFQQRGVPGAIFCHNDEIAVVTYRALRDLGYEVPGDVLLCGCDGVEYINYFDTPLSTIAIPWEEVGEMACQFLKQRIEAPEMPVQEHTVIGKLVARKSLMA
ncbi:LacI family transcriptional regulator [bacterium]|nr:MAG: LacI family transcriptional regulator [bacterium]